MTDDEKEKYKDIKIILTWIFCVPFDLILLFSPLAVLRFIFDMNGMLSTVAGLFIGLFLLFVGGLFPKIPDSDNKGDKDN